MTMTFDEGKPSPEDVLHFGKKGMKWGVRKKYTAKEIYAARRRVRKADVNATTEAQEKKVNRSKDASIAMRLTRGEKAAAVILTGPVGLLLIGANSAATRHHEKKSGLRKQVKK